MVRVMRTRWIEEGNRMSISFSCEINRPNCLRSLFNILLFSFIALALEGCVATPYFNNQATSQLTTEGEIVSGMGYQDTGVTAPDFPMAFPLQAVNVRIYKDPEQSLAAFKTFDFDYTSKDNPLLEKELFHQLEKVLQARGLPRDKENPQILITMNFFAGKKEQYVPPTTITSTKVQNVWNTGMIGWNVIGYNTPVPVTSSETTPGYTVVSYYCNVRLNFLDRAKLVGTPKPEAPPLLWIGESDYEGAEPDIRGIAPVMFGELMGEFPDLSNKGSRRQLRCFRFGGLGLEFDPTDWRAIRYVEPGSVAAENGIKPGDTLLEINGENAFNWPSFYGNVYRPSDPWKYYRSKDPYFRHVLSNRGDRDVELLIRSAETGRRVTLKVRPRDGDRYLYVDDGGIPLLSR